MLIALVFGVIVHFSICDTKSPVYVDTSVGTILGFQEQILFDGEKKLISKFLGIPFAESTGGQNRFKKPVPKAPFNTTFDARKTSVACYQQSKQDSNLYKDVYGVPAFSEDCLTLNIYVPHGLPANDLRPVMIWVYGGGFIQGAASVYKPEGLAIFGNVIIVTINYRIGMFGFLRDPKGIFPGNQGLWDQHLAFKWVHNHIDKFSGYKDEITIFGQSAGGASVIFQALYPGNKGLFKRVIAQSGSAIAPWAIHKVSSYERYFNDKGCNTLLNNFASCILSKSPLSLQSNVTNFGPVIDDDFVIASPADIVNSNSTITARARAFFASLDIILGVNDKDGAGFFASFLDALNQSNLEFNISKNDFRNTVVPSLINSTLAPENIDIKAAIEKVLTFSYTDWNNPDDYASIWKHVTNLANDAAFFSPASQTADAHAKLNVGKTYLYEFAVQTITHYIPVPSWMKGSNHADEIQFIYGLPLRENVSMGGLSNFSYTSEQKQVARATMAMWSNFAKSGNPNLPMDITQFTNTTWPAYNKISQRYFRISDQMSPASIIEGFYPKRMALWSDIIRKIVRTNNYPVFHFDPSTELVG